MDANYALSVHLYGKYSLFAGQVFKTVKQKKKALRYQSIPLSCLYSWALANSASRPKQIFLKGALATILTKTNHVLEIGK